MRRPTAVVHAATCFRYSALVRAPIWPYSELAVTCGRGQPHVKKATRPSVAAQKAMAAAAGFFYSNMLLHGGRRQGGGGAWRGPPPDRVSDGNFYCQPCDGVCRRTECAGCGAWVCPRGHELGGWGVAAAAAQGRCSRHTPVRPPPPPPHPPAAPVCCAIS